MINNQSASLAETQTLHRAWDMALALTAAGNTLRLTPIFGRGHNNNRHECMLRRSSM
jgi:hypothetical protein